MPYLISMNLLHLENVAHVGSYRNLITLSNCEEIFAIVVNLIHAKVLPGSICTLKFSIAPNLKKMKSGCCGYVIDQD